MFASNFARRQITILTMTKEVRQKWRQKIIKGKITRILDLKGWKIIRSLTVENDSSWAPPGLQRLDNDEGLFICYLGNVFHIWKCALGNWRCGSRACFWGVNFQIRLLRQKVTFGNGYNGEIGLHMKSNFKTGFISLLTKHCQRHSGPDGWVHITSPTQILIKLQFRNL